MNELNTVNAWVAVRRAHSGMKKPCGSVSVEFPKSADDAIYKVLGGTGMIDSRFVVLADQSGITIRRMSREEKDSGEYGQRFTLFNFKASTRTGFKRPSRIVAKRAAQYVPGLNMCPEFGLGAVTAKLYPDAGCIFIPFPPQGDRKRVKKQHYKGGTASGSEVSHGGDSGGVRPEPTQGSIFNTTVSQVATKAPEPELDREAVKEAIEGTIVEEPKIHMLIDIGGAMAAYPTVSLSHRLQMHHWLMGKGYLPSLSDATVKASG